MGLGCWGEEGYVLMDDMPYWKHALREDMSLQRTCDTGGCFFLWYNYSEDMT